MITDPEIVHGELILVGTRIPAKSVLENCEAYLMQGFPLEGAIQATLRYFPGIPEGAEGIRRLLDYSDPQELLSAA